jgi:tryptophan synthase beta subunit
VCACVCVCVCVCLCACVCECIGEGSRNLGLYDEYVSVASSMQSVNLHSLRVAGLSINDMMLRGGEKRS